jgi:hypothetical protein
MHIMKNVMDETCSTQGGGQKCIHNIGQKILEQGATCGADA